MYSGKIAVPPGGGGIRTQSTLLIVFSLVSEKMFSTKFVFLIPFDKHSDKD
jgi:hypothetical protein